MNSIIKTNGVINSEFMPNNVFGKLFCIYHGIFNYEYINESLFEDSIHSTLLDDYEKEILEYKDKIKDNEKEKEMYKFIDSFIVDSNHYDMDVILNDNFTKEFKKFQIENVNNVIWEMERGIFKDLKCVSVYSPGEYNFRGDSFDIEYSIDKDKKEIQNELFYFFDSIENKKEINELLENAFKSRDGFHSYYNHFSSLDSLKKVIKNNEDFENDFNELLAVYFSILNYDYDEEYYPENIYNFNWYNDNYNYIDEIVDKMRDIKKLERC